MQNTKESAKKQVDTYLTQVKADCAQIKAATTDLAKTLHDQRHLSETVIQGHLDRTTAAITLISRNAKKAAKEQNEKLQQDVCGAVDALNVTLKGYLPIVSAIIEGRKELAAEVTAASKEAAEIVAASVKDAADTNKEVQS